jgi:oxygen-independent coproporphyrinogen-3 oxidase
MYRHLYAHVPFCARRCAYCDFAISVRRQVPVAEFVQGVREELRVRDVAALGLRLDTLYLGGGTPSRLGPSGVATLLDALHAAFAVERDAEITLEANPEDVTVEAVRSWREHGVNRLSIGIQSFDDRVLRWMHRVHDADAARRAVDAARRGGIESYSLDLIFSVPEALERDWSRDLAEALALAPEHVSLYGLTVEPHTPLGRWHERGEVFENPEERYEAEFLEAHATLVAAGFEHYEVSNFARPGRRARHNSAYWRGVPYLGVGPASHGFDGAARRWNVAAYAAWERTLRAGQDPVGGVERLDAANRIAESVYLGLRTLDGLEVSRDEWMALSSWVRAGWIEPAGDEASPTGWRVRCTPMGWLRLDALAADLTARRSR